MMCSLQTAVMKDAISTSRVAWSPDGHYVGMFHSGFFDACLHHVYHYQIINLIYVFVSLV